MVLYDQGIATCIRMELIAIGRDNSQLSTTNILDLELKHIPSDLRKLFMVLRQCGASVCKVAPSLMSFHSEVRS